MLRGPDANANAMSTPQLQSTGRVWCGEAWSYNATPDCEALSPDDWTWRSEPQQCMFGRGTVLRSAAMSPDSKGSGQRSGASTFLDAVLVVFAWQVCCAATDGASTRILYARAALIESRLLLSGSLE